MITKDDGKTHWIVIIWAALCAAAAHMAMTAQGMHSMLSGGIAIAGSVIAAGLAYHFPSFMKVALGALVGGITLGLAAKHACPANLNDMWVYISGGVGGMVGGWVVARGRIAAAVHAALSFLAGALLAFLLTHGMWAVYLMFMQIGTPGIDTTGLTYDQGWVHTQTALTLLLGLAIWWSGALPCSSRTGANDTSSS